jgi:hypothetical protein
MGGVHAEHVALAGAPEGSLDVADAVDRVPGYPAKGHPRRDGPLDHRCGQLGLGPEGCSSRNMGRGHAGLIICPDLGQIKRPVDERMAVARDVGGKHANLAVRDLARRPGVLAPDPARGPTLLEKAGLVDDQNSIRIPQGVDRVLAHDLAKRIGVPLCPTQ